MKVFLISNMYPSPDNPGFGVFVKNVAEGLEPHGIKVTKRAVIRGVSKSRLSRLYKYAKFYLSILKGFFYDYDFIYVHFPNQMIPLLKILYKFRQPEIYLNFHGEDLLYEESGMHGWLGRSMESFTRRYVSGVVVPSQYYADIVAGKKLIEKDRIIVSPSGGISSDIFYPKDKALVVQSPLRPLRLGYVGRLEPGKGILEFLEVVKRLKDIDLKYEATIIGYGTLMSETLRFISAHNLSRLVGIIPGVPQAEIGAHYRDFDLLIFLSSRAQESLGLTGIESMACGTPVVGSDVGGIASYLKDGINGYMISNISDIDNVVDVIKKYADLPAEARLKMYDAAVETGAKYFSHDVCHRLALDFSK